MDFSSLQGQRTPGFSSSSPHRMPTVSASQALQDLNSPASRTIRTGLPGLDRLFRGSSSVSATAPGQHGGVVRGQVTEIYGPPGVGKTAVGIQLATRALSMGQSVVWVDGSHPLAGPRLVEVLSSSRPLSEQDRSISVSGNYDASDPLKNLVHFTTPSLPHFVALFCHTTPSFPPSNTSLVVIDSFSTLIACTFPRNLDSRAISKKPGTASKHDPQSWAQSRKWAVLQHVMSCLQKLAAVHNIAVVILGQTVTKMQLGARAMLVPAILSTGWDAGIATRIILFRDWGWRGTQVRFASAFKVDGVFVRGRGGPDTIVAFTIESHGLEETQVSLTTLPVDLNVTATPQRKRKAVEIRDSDEEENLHDSEDYGWAEEDDGELPQAPSQWQGSEDILVPGPQDRADDEEDEVHDSQEEEMETGI